MNCRGSARCRLELQARESEKGEVSRFRNVSIASRTAVRNVEDESVEGLNDSPFTRETSREVRGGVGAAIQRARSLGRAEREGGW